MMSKKILFLLAIAPFAAFANVDYSQLTNEIADDHADTIGGLISAGAAIASIYIIVRGVTMTLQLVKGGSAKEEKNSKESSALKKKRDAYIQKRNSRRGI